MNNASKIASLIIHVADSGDKVKARRLIVEAINNAFQRGQDHKEVEAVKRYNIDANQSPLRKQITIIQRNISEQKTLKNKIDFINRTIRPNLHFSNRACDCVIRQLTKGL